MLLATWFDTVVMVADGYRLWDFDSESDDGLKKLDLALAGFGGGLTFHF